MNIAGMMLREALDYAGVPVKAIARESHYSDDAFYAAISGKRPFPQEARKKISGVHLLGGLAVCYEGTGYKIFRCVEGDRHIHAMLTRACKEDRDRDDALKDLPFVLLDKQGAGDLAPDEVSQLKEALVEILESIQVDLNLVMELDSKFKLGVLEWLKDKKHDSRRQARSRVR